MTDTKGQTGKFEGLEVGKITGKFLVPSYQRGYRWGRTEVQQLLDDINESQGTYYLQPIVVKRVTEDQWELVDGQQRLTTLMLILQFIKQTALPSAEVLYSIVYETRQRSAEFLQSPNEDLARSNIDFFHIYEAWTTIQEWFADQDNEVLAAIGIYQDLSSRVKVIWYEAPDNVNATELFTRLNVGKIPLTDAELVKALLLSRIQQVGKESTDYSQATAAEWDAVERELRNPELWAFVSGKANPEATHIEFLLDTMAGTPDSGPCPPFHTFQTLRAQIEDDPEAFWNKVTDLHSLIVGWFEDRSFFHKIGYLVASGYSFERVLELSEGTKNSEFEAKLDAAISERLNVSKDMLPNLSYSERHDHKRLFAVLLLMNVETIRTLKHSNERYSFHSHARGKWSLEHIHAQNAEPLRTVEQWKQWLGEHRWALRTLPSISDEERTDLESKITKALPKIDQATFYELERELEQYFTQDTKNKMPVDPHTISNLALLDSDDNSVLNNSKFQVKRLKIIQLDRAGSYIPICTRNVFLKYYAGGQPQDLQFWGAQDRADYLAAIQRVLAPYLSADAQKTFTNEEEV